MDPTDFMEEGALEIDMDAEPDLSQEDHIELDQVPETSDDNIVLNSEEPVEDKNAEQDTEELQIDEEMGETAEITEMQEDVVQEQEEVEDVEEVDEVVENEEVVKETSEDQQE